MAHHLARTTTRHLPQHQCGTTPPPASPTTASSRTSTPSPASDHDRPTRPTADRWKDLMLRLLEDRLWLADHPTPAVDPIATSTPDSNSSTAGKNCTTPRRPRLPISDSSSTGSCTHTSTQPRCTSTSPRRWPAKTTAANGSSPTGRTSSNSNKSPNSSPPRSHSHTGRLRNPTPFATSSTNYAFSPVKSISVRSAPSLNSRSNGGTATPSFDSRHAVSTSSDLLKRPCRHTKGSAPPRVGIARHRASPGASGSHSRAGLRQVPPQCSRRSTRYPHHHPRRRHPHLAAHVGNRPCSVPAQQQPAQGHRHDRAGYPDHPGRSSP